MVRALYFDDSDGVRIMQKGFDEWMVLTFKSKLDVVGVITNRINKLELDLRRILKAQVHSKEHIRSLCEEMSLMFALLRKLINMLPESYNRQVYVKTWKDLEDWEEGEGYIHDMLKRIAIDFGEATARTWETWEYDFEVFAAKEW